jgi:hypothetical protein
VRVCQPAEQSRAEQSRAEQSRAEQSRAEQSKPDDIIKVGILIKPILMTSQVCMYVQYRTYSTVQ